MIWFLRLFPRYRELEKAAREAADLATRLQDINFTLTEQNAKLVERQNESHDAQIAAYKMIANIRMQRDFGGMPPYPEAYSLPKQTEPDMGPIATDRIHGRDMVNAGLEEFHTKIRQMSGR